MNIEGFMKQMGIDIPYEELTSAERETFHQWLQDLSVRTVTLEDVKEHIHALRISVDDALAHEDNSKEKDLMLKARLRNLILIEAFLTSADRAKKALERTIKKR